MTPALLATLGNSVWVHENTDKLKQVLPQQWSEPGEAFGLPFRYKLKVAGIAYRTESDLADILAVFHSSGLLLQQGNRWKVNPEWSYLDVSHNSLRSPSSITNLH